MALTSNPSSISTATPATLFSLGRSNELVRIQRNRQFGKGRLVREESLHALVIAFGGVLKERVEGSRAGGGAGGSEQLGALAVPAQHRLLARRPGLVRVVAGTASLRVDTVVEQQAHVAGKPGAGRGPQLLFDHLTRRRVHGREQAVPPTAVSTPEAELEQQLEPAIVSVPMAVVQRLFVVGVGAVGEQQASERDPVTVSRRIALARSERAGERGERRAVGEAREPQELLDELLLIADRRNLGPERRRAGNEKLQPLRWASPFPRTGGDLLAAFDHNAGEGGRGCNGGHPRDSGAGLPALGADPAGTMRRLPIDVPNPGCGRSGIPRMHRLPRRG